jgi:hypothetical protein
VADSSPLVVRRYLAWAQSQLAQVRNHDPRQSQGFARLVPDMALQGRCCRRSSFSPVSGAGAALIIERKCAASECDLLDERAF